MLNDVQVFRIPWGTEPWRVQCAHCECMVVGKWTWAGAMRFANRHAAEHEADRCGRCGRTS